MLRWIPYTFIRTVLFFIGGIVLGYYKPGIVPESISLLIIFSLALFYFIVVRNQRVRRGVGNPGWIALLLIFVLGYVHTLFRTATRQENHIVHMDESVTSYSAVVTRFAEEKVKSWKTEVRVEYVCTNRWKAAEGKVLLYLSKDDFPEPFEYGDCLLIKGKPLRVEPPTNPGEFDYAKYLSLRNIYHQHFVRGGEVMKTGHAPDNLFVAVAYKARKWSEQTLEHFVHGERGQAIASALVLGVTDGLDNELLDAYSATGTMHILAVSGLHISILYVILLRIFSPLNKGRGGRWAVAFVSLALLWMYALITGLSPSVLRAVMMFSFFAIARPWAKSANVYNTLGVSAFFLLLYDPFLIFSVGFQLSYLAVLGIVYIYPRILPLWEPPYVVLVEVWKLCAVSLAAQAATFPLGLLYFHQFPNYFLLSNLLVVPLSFAVLIAGLVTLVVSIVPLLAMAVGFCLTWVIRLLNGIVFTLDDFPFAVTDGIYISALQAILLLLLIAFISTLVEMKKFRYAVYCFVTVCAFAGLQWVHFFRDVHVRKIAVYDISGHTAIDLMDRGQTCFIADDPLKEDARKIRYHIGPHRIKTGIRSDGDYASVHAFEGGKLILWNGFRILQLTEDDFAVPRGLDVDWLIIGNNAVRDVRRIAGAIRCKRVVLDSSNSRFFASRFLEDAKLYKLEVHSVVHQGYLECSI